MRNEQLELWVLHVWLGRDNPAGLYASWNPDVRAIMPSNRRTAPE
jgi:hypothetical protein